MSTIEIETAKKENLVKDITNLREKRKEIEKIKEKVRTSILEELDFLSEEKGGDLIDFLLKAGSRKIEITATRVDSNEDTGKPFHYISLDMKESQYGDDLFTNLGIGIFPKEISNLEPADGWKKTIEMTRKLKDLLEEIGVPTATLQRVPVMIPKKPQEYQTKPLVF